MWDDLNPTARSWFAVAMSRLWRSHVTSSRPGRCGSPRGDLGRQVMGDYLDAVQRE